MADGNTSDDSSNSSTSQEVQVAFPGQFLSPQGESNVLDEKILLNYEAIKDLYSSIEKILNQNCAESSSQLSSGSVQDVIQKLSGRYSNAFKVLLDRVNEWKLERNSSIEKLNNIMYQLDRNFKWSTIVRLVSSTIDLSAYVGGLLFRSEATWVNHVFDAVTYFGLTSLFLTVSDVVVAKNILKDVKEIVKKDLKLMEPILEWFKESGELDAAVKDLFPHALDLSTVQEIEADAKELNAELNDNLQIFQALLLSSIRKDNKLCNNMDFLHKVRLFADSEVGKLWWKRMQFRKHPITLDSCRMEFQLEFEQTKSVLFQSIWALPLEQEKLTSPPVVVRILFNLLSMYDSVTDLRGGALSVHSDKMTKLVDTMTRELNCIENNVTKAETQMRNTGTEDTG